MIPAEVKANTIRGIRSNTFSGGGYEVERRNKIGNSLTISRKFFPHQPEIFVLLLGLLFDTRDRHLVFVILNIGGLESVMSEPVEILTEAVLQEQVSCLKEAAAKSTDPCLTAKAIAMCDSRVQGTLLDKLHKQRHVLRGIECLDRVGIPENKSVYFDIECKPGTFCFIKPAFLVVVNIVDGYVVAVVDPFILTPTAMHGMSESKCACEQESVAVLRDTCISVTINDGEACLNVPGFGNVCVACPGFPDGTVAEACFRICNFTRLRVRIRVLGNVISCARFGSGSGCNC